MATEAEIIESVTAVIEGCLVPSVLERHQRDIISGLLWTITEARGKYTTRYRSRAAMGGIVGSNFYLAEGAPEQDVVVAGTLYMEILVRIAGEAYERFWTSIDLPANFTPEDLAARGQTIEDIEEEFGYPRGWSAGRPEGERLAWMKEFSRTEMERLRRRYP